MRKTFHLAQISLSGMNLSLELDVTSFLRKGTLSWYKTAQLQDPRPFTYNAVK